MTPRERLERLDAVAARLPFHVEDHEAANRTFARWAAACARGEPADAALAEVELWAYCFTQRYALVRFLREPGLGTPADLDALVSATFLRVRENLTRVTDPARFSRWVSVVCHNTLVTHCRRRTLEPSIGYERLDEVADTPPDDLLGLDRAAVRRALQAAVARLPRRLARVARMRLIEGRPYDDIAEQTGYTGAILRSYTAKAMLRLRADPALRELMRELSGRLPSDAPAGRSP